MSRRILGRALLLSMAAAAVLTGCGQGPGAQGTPPSLWTAEFSSTSQDAPFGVSGASLFESDEGLTLRFSLDLSRRVESQEDVKLGGVSVINLPEAIPTYNGPAVTRVVAVLADWEKQEPVIQENLEPKTFNNHDFLSKVWMDRGAVIVDLLEDADVRVERQGETLDVIMINCAQNQCPPEFQRESVREGGISIH